MGEPLARVGVLDHGCLELIEVMPTERGKGDVAVVAAARISYGREASKGPAADGKLIRYLARNGHTTPFEMAEMKWRVRAPIFVERQWIRHRTASINSVSGRYTELPDEFYSPADAGALHLQSASNRQGGEAPAGASTAEAFGYEQRALWNSAYQAYKRAVGAGVSREQARLLLPVSLYTQWIWKSNLWNTIHFLRLRTDAHAQWEIRQYALAMLAIAREWFPLSIAAHLDPPPPGLEH